MRGARAEQKTEPLAWVLHLVRLRGWRGAFPISSRAARSSGSRWRAAGLAAALLLLDEPLANLDRELRKEMEIEVRRFQIELGIPFIYVTHNQEEALTMSDRIAVMRTAGSNRSAPSSIYHRPPTAFVAAFRRRARTHASARSSA